MITLGFSVTIWYEPIKSERKTKQWMSLGQREGKTYSAWADEGSHCSGLEIGKAAVLSNACRRCWRAWGLLAQVPGHRCTEPDGLFPSIGYAQRTEAASLTATASSQTRNRADCSISFFLKLQTWATHSKAKSGAIIVSEGHVKDPVWGGWIVQIVFYI